jgi:maltooligosyltrehalose trehalohydrolase
MPHLCRCLAEGFAYQGDYSEFHGEKRGERSDYLPPTAFVSFLQNHDQVGNRAFGERITKLAPLQTVKLAMEILLLAPQPPLLFMGEEFAATTPFLFFCDFHGDLAAAITNGRRNEFAHFAKFNSLDVRESIPDPNDESTFEKSKLDWESLQNKLHQGWLHLYRELLALRQSKIVPHLGGSAATRCDTGSGAKRWISVDWIFNDRTTLQLRANLGHEPLTISTSDPANTIYASTAEAAAAIHHGSLVPYSGVWSLQS